MHCRNAGTKTKTNIEVFTNRVRFIKTKHWALGGISLIMSV